ncbi:MAG: hypothetical protein ABFD69_09885 [Candidatus Sumerlaeia bacterium]
MKTMVGRVCDPTLKTRQFVQLVCFFTLVFLIPTARAADLVSIYCQVFRTTGNLVGDTSIDENVWAGARPPSAELQRAVTLFNEGHFRLDQDRLDAKINGWKWNDKDIPITKARESRILPEDKVQLIESWTNIVPGQTANFEIGSQQQLEYFEKTGSDLYQLRKLDALTGLKIGMRVDGRLGDPLLRVSNLTISLKSVEKREPLEGTLLPVGRPVLNEAQYKLALKLRSGNSYGILLHPGEGQGVLIIRLNIAVGRPVSPKPASEQTTPPSATSAYKESK